MATEKNLTNLPAAPSGARNGTWQVDPSPSGTDATTGQPYFNVSLYMPDMVGDTGSGGQDGLVPAPAAGDAAAGKFLKADGTWEVTGSSPIASISFVQGANNLTFFATSLSLAFGANNTAGNCLVVDVLYDSATAGTISDTLSNTYSLVQIVTSGGKTSATWVAYNCAAGANTVTIAASGGTGTGIVAVHEYSGVKTASAVDTSTSTSAVGTGNLTVSVTTTAYGDLLHLWGCGGNTLTGVSDSAGYTVRETNTGGAIGGRSFDYVASSAAAYSDTVTYSGSISSTNTFATLIALFAAPPSTVTSVALTVPSRQSVSGSPITSSGTLAITDNTQNANLVFAGPSSGSAAVPTFRTLVSADVPGSLSNPMTTMGDIIYGGASGAPARLGAGTSGYVLQTNGTGAAPTWVAGGGGGSGSYPPVAFTTPPTAGTLTKVDASGGSSTASNITSGALLLTTTSFSGTNDHMLLKAIPAAPYTFTVCVAIDVQAINYSTSGIFFYDGTKVRLFGLQYSNGYNYTVANHTNVNTYGSTPYASNVGTSSTLNLIWLQVHDDGTNIHFRVSTHGADFSEELYSESNTAFLTPTYIGIGIDNESNTAGNLLCMSWNGV